MTAPSRADAIRSLAADQLAAEVITLLDDGGVPAVLLKGGPLARWLYPPGWVRPVADVDLLVAPTSVAAASRLLRDAGWVCRPNRFVTHATTWTRQGVPFPVDLHTSFHFVAVEPERLWELVTRDADGCEVAGVTVTVPSRTTALTFLGLHAAAADRRAASEFGRAVDASGEADLLAAVELARELGALDAFAISLRRCKQAVGVAEALSLPAAMPEDQALRMDPPPRTTAGFLRLESAVGAAEIGRQLARELVPAPGHIRDCYPRLAATGRLGLIAGYLWRPFDVARRAPGGWTAWQRLRRRVDVEPRRIGTLTRIALGIEILVAYTGSRLVLRRYGVGRAVEWARGAAAEFPGRLMASPSADVAAGRRLDHVVRRALARVPGDTRCLVRSLVLLRLLAHRGIAGTLVLAVRKQDRLAHAWVEVEGSAVSAPAEDGFVRVTAL